MAQKQPQRGHDDIAHQRLNDLPEGDADDNANRHIEHGTLHRKCLEFFPHISPPGISQIWMCLLRTDFVMNRSYCQWELSHRNFALLAQNRGSAGQRDDIAPTKLYNSYLVRILPT